MATFTLKLDDDTLRKLTDAAQRAGVTPERMAEMMVESWLFNGDVGSAGDGAGVRERARAWMDEMASAGNGEGGSGHELLTTVNDYEGPFVDLDTALDNFSAELNRRRRSPAV